MPVVEANGIRLHYESVGSGRPVVFGLTNAGRHLMVVFEIVDDSTVYPITAYEVSQRQSP